MKELIEKAVREYLADKEAVAETHRKIEETVERLDKESRIDPALLDEPVTI